MRRVRHSRRRAGFTLLELILVMIILCTALAAVAPSLRGFSRGASAQNAAGQILALARYARSQAVADARVYRLSLDPTGVYYLSVQDAQGYSTLGSDFGRPFAVPEDCKIELTGITLDGSGIRFFPDGRTDPGIIRVVGPGGEEILLSAPSPTEAFEMRAAGSNGGTAYP